MRHYSDLLQDVSARFRKIQSRHQNLMRCKSGCVRCCHGLFDISLPDAIHVAAGVAALPPEAKANVAMRAADIQKKISREEPAWAPPFLLRMEDDPLIERIVARVPNARCPLLDKADACLIYPHRPLACRLEGLPMVDEQDGLFGDWCEFNFLDGVSSQEQDELQRNYYELQETERTSTLHLSELLLGERLEVLTVFIPSLIAELDNFWTPLIARVRSDELNLTASD